MARIDILLPVYQGFPFLVRCVDSLYKQTLEDFKVYISDDGSTDGCREYLAQITDPRFHYTPNPHRLGLFGSLNFLWDQGRSPLTRILCQDDWLVPHCLETETKFHQEHPGLAFSFCKTTKINAHGRPVSQDRLDDLPRVLKPALLVQQLYYHGCVPGNLSTVCLNRELVGETPPFDTHFKVAADYDLWSRLAVKFSAGVIQERLVHLREHEMQLSRSRAAGLLFIDENRTVRAELFKHLPQEKLRAAKKYTRRRQDVLDFHHSLRAAFRGDTGRIVKSWKSRGLVSTFSAAVWWFLTASNRLFRPQAPWQLD